LSTLSESLAKEGGQPIHIRKADELLEAEDLLEMLHAGMIPLTVMDDYKADFWSGVFPDLLVRDDLVINENGSIAWAHRADSPELAALLEKFLRLYGRGTLVGNDTFNRYLADSGKVRCAFESIERFPDVVQALQKYAAAFDYDWLMLAAQGFQESGLRQNRRSHAGAVGIMQIKPSTAADPNVGVSNVENLDDNIHAGAKYMRFLANRYFEGDDVDTLNQWFFALAAYNAGPARVASLRSEAGKSGYDRNLWFDNVEIIAAKRIGAETVTYVGNIYKYYVGYQLTALRIEEERERFGAEGTGCSDTTG
jgi:membrane-bound lytic murein transglycosylase MltF